MDKKELLKLLKGVDLDINDLKEILLDHFVKENEGYKWLDIRNLDFSDFDGDVDISHMKVKKDLKQSFQIVDGMLFQNYQTVKDDLHQDNQNVKEDLWQNYQIVEKNLWQDRQNVERDLYQDQQNVKMDIYQDKL